MTTYTICVFTENTIGILNKITTILPRSHVKQCWLMLLPVKSSSKPELATREALKWIPLSGSRRWKKLPTDSLRKLTPSLSLGITFVILAAGVLWSLWKTRGEVEANKA